jgi:glucose/arabinose dehydrogenase
MGASRQTILGTGRTPTGELWVADVGHRQWEEINHVPADAAGLNYGWPIMEGQHCYAAEGCEQAGLVVPVAEYSHARGCAVVGGHVYRGQAMPELQGQYLFGDFCQGRIWSVPAAGEAPISPTLLLDSELAITAFGEDEAGELYVTDYEGGLYRLRSAP